jgi:hypothetical protein
MANMNVAYSPLQEEASLPTTTTAETRAEPSAAEMCLMKRASRMVIILSLFQLGLGIFSLFAGGFLWFLVATVFAAFGIVGAAKKRVRLLKAHFVYSIILYIFTLIGVVLMIAYCQECNIFAYLMVLVALLVQAIGMRHSRLLLNFLNTYPQYATVCRGSWRCRSSACNTTTASSINNNNNSVVVPMEAAQPTPVQQTQPMQAMQAMQPAQPLQVPVYMPPQVMAVPQYYPMQNVQYKYPVMHPQQVQMMPMQMQAYPYPYPVPPQEPAPANLYPTIPVVYKQN